MRIELAALAVAGMIAATGGAQAASPCWLGEWKLNVEQSKYPAGFPAIHDHHTSVTKDDGTSLAYTDYFTIGDQPPGQVSFDGAYDGKPYKTSDGR